MSTQPGEPHTPRAPIIDAHVHLIGMRPEHGCRVGPRLSRGPAYHILTRALGLNDAPRERIDDAYADRMLAWAHLSELDAIGVLALDGVYDSQGRLDERMTQLMTGNDYCLEVCARSSKLLPICSVNPQRRDAIDELDRVVERGTVAIKLLPNSQGFDPGSPAYTRFWQRCADHDVPILTHTSFEHTVPPISQEFGLPQRLRLPLEQGVRVIAAHCAGSGVAHPFHEDFDTWLAMLSEHENLWGDISAMASVSRYPYIHRVLRSELALSRVILGSDYPVPVSPAVFLPQLGLGGVRNLLKIANPIQRNIETFRALGVPKEVMERSAQVLRLTSAARASLVSLR